MEYVLSHLDLTCINVTLDIVCALFSLVLMVYPLFQTDGNRRLNRLFVLLCLGNIGMLLGDIPNWLCEGFARPWYPAALWLGCFVQYISGVMEPLFYSAYLVTYLPKEARIHPSFFYVIGILGIFIISCVIVNLWNGMFYYIDSQNIYHRGDWWLVTQIVSIWILLVDMMIVLLYRNFMPSKTLYTFLAYQLLPFPAIVIQSLYYGIAITYPAITFAILIIFLNIQSDQARRLSEKELELEKSRTAIMLSQIQPHFLYNALTGIKELCQTEPKVAAEALEHFSYFLRGNLDSLVDARQIPFQKELAHVRDYLYLERMRFRECVRIEWQIGFLDFSLPPLTLQPIVENAVRYGITKKKGGGTIAIKSERIKENVVITVTDDGVGFDVDGMIEDGRTHTGIVNVRSRLEIQCSGTLYIKSEKGKGTEVTIILPQREDL